MSWPSSSRVRSLKHAMPSLDDDMEDAVKEQYDREFDVPTDLVSLAHIDRVSLLLRRICTQTPLNRSAFDNQVRAVREVIRLLDGYNWVKSAIEKECQSLYPSQFQQELRLMHMVGIKYEFPLSARRLEYLEGDARQSGVSDENWNEYKSNLGKSRAAEANYIIYQLNRHPVLLFRARAFNTLCSFLKWYTDIIRKTWKRDHVIE